MKAKILSILLILCFAIGLLAGCSGGSAPSATPSSGGSSSSKPSASAAPSAAPSATPNMDFESWDVDNYAIDESRYGGDLTVVGGMPVTMFMCETGNKTTWSGTAPAIESLGLIDKEGNVHPFLAESFTEDAKKLTFTIKLRKGIMFHDGSELTADVLMWNFEQFHANGINAYISNAKSWEKTDDYTVVMHFDVFSNTWAEMISQLRVCSQKSYEDKGVDYIKTHAVGTGPFVFDSMVEGTSVKYVRNENYWIKGLPYLDSITIENLTDDNTKLAAMSTGDVQQLTASGGNLADQLSTLKGISMITGDSPALKSITFIAPDSYTDGKPTFDVKVRQAMMYALDREAMAQALTGGYFHGINQYAVKGSYGYLEDSKLFSPYEYSPEKAKALLAEAGYPNGFKLTCHTRSGFQNLVVALQSYWKEVGIDLEIILVDNAKNSELTTGKSFGVMDLGTAGTAPCSFNNYFNWIQKVGKDRTTYQDVLGDFDELDNLLATANQASELDDIKSGLQAVNYWLSENMIIRPMYASFQMLYSTDNLHDTGRFDVHDYQSTYHLAYFD